MNVNLYYVHKFTLTCIYVTFGQCLLSNHLFWKNVDTSVCPARVYFDHLFKTQEHLYNLTLQLLHLLPCTFHHNNFSLGIPPRRHTCSIGPHLHIFLSVIVFWQLQYNVFQRITTNESSSYKKKLGKHFHFMHILCGGEAIQRS